MTTTPFAVTTDPRAAVCYGEIYSFEGRFWAEIIVEEDGFASVTAQSTEFANREAAVAWLADNGLFFPPTFAERAAAFFAGLKARLNTSGARAPRLARAAG